MDKNETFWIKNEIKDLIKDHEFYGRESKISYSFFLYSNFFTYDNHTENFKKGKLTYIDFNC